MAGNICPLLQEACKSNCRWFNLAEGNCYIVSIYEMLNNVADRLEHVRDEALENSSKIGR